MMNIEELLGKRYTDLSSLPALTGIEIPPLEQIVDQSYVSFLTLGISLVLPDNQTVSVIQLHGDQHEGFTGYADALPCGLSFSMNRVAVRNALGIPEKSGEEKAVPVLGKKPGWDSFLVRGVRLHIAYTPGSNAIRLVTLTKK